jgi:hypothetical protein
MAEWLSVDERFQLQSSENVYQANHVTRCLSTASSNPSVVTFIRLKRMRKTVKSKSEKNGNHTEIGAGYHLKRRHACYK